MSIEKILSFIGSFLNFCKCVIQSKFKIYQVAKNSVELTILANGPSLKKILARGIAFQTDVLVVNSFHTSEFFTKIKPQHYVIAAPEFWIFIDDPVYIKMQEQLEFSLKNDVDWDMTFYIPYKSKSHSYKTKIEKLNGKITVAYYNATGIDSYHFLDRMAMKLKLAMPRPHNVLLPSIMIGLWGGYKLINIYGADHSWLPLIRVNNKNVPMISQNHFYDNKQQQYKPMDKMGSGQRKLHEILHKFYLSFKGYHIIERYARQNGVTILNATEDSYIDAFERATQPEEST